MSFTYDYPRPMVTADIYLLRKAEDALQLLLIQRQNEPFRRQWALPGGFIEIEEKLMTSALRELREETGLKDLPLRPLLSAGDPGRDPRGRTITIVYAGIPAPPFPRAVAGDDAGKARWFNLQQLPELAFDHAQICRSALEEIRFRAIWQLWLLMFLPETFTMETVLQTLSLMQIAPAMADPLLQVASAAGLIQKIENQDYLKIKDNNQIFSHTPAEISRFWTEKITG
ncbi:MAG: NUDIX hydrolase [Calditrichia bacterium]